MKLQAGLYYITRIGQTVGPLEPCFQPRWPEYKWKVERGPAGPWHYTDDGQSFKNITYGDDIVALAPGQIEEPAWLGEWEDAE
jgi:hypothetical protein